MPSEPNNAEEKGEKMNDDKIEQVARAFDEMLAFHAECRWEQVGPCVYCTNHNQRLYQGQLPAERNPAAAVCAAEGHEWDDADSMGQSGFYYLCTRCGEQEWPE